MGNWERLVWNQRDALLAGLAVTVEVCVIAFMALSGYLVTQSWEQDPRVAIFFAKRALRILPALVVVVVVTGVTRVRVVRVTVVVAVTVTVVRPGAKSVPDACV